MFDEVVTLRKGEQAPFLGTGTVSTGILDISGTPIYALFDANGDAVAGQSGGAVVDTNSAATVKARHELVTAALDPGVYVLQIGFLATATEDGLTRTYETLIGLRLDSATGAQSAPARYPHAVDLWLFLQAAGVLPTGAAAKAALTGQFGTAVLAAREALEAACDRTFLAGDNDVEKRFDPPTGRGSILRIPDLAEVVSVEYTPQGSAAETLTEGEDFISELWDDRRETSPVVALQFNRRFSLPLSFSQRRSIYVTGAWGYGTTLPGDVWQAMLAGAAVWLWEQVVLQATGGKLDVKQGNTSVSFGVEPWRHRVEGWQAQVKATAMMYRRMS